MSDWITPERLQQACRSVALENFESYLTALCTDKSKHFPIEPGCTFDQGPGEYTPDTWYFYKPLTTLLEAMEMHMEKTRKRIAMTEVALKVFDALSYAWEEKAMVRIEGDTRFGKTESIRAWCDMFPGRARLVTVPCSNSDKDLFKAVAESFGLDLSQAISTQRLKEKLDYILKHGRLFLVLDESHFLIPSRYTETTTPMRLNWVRTQIVDKKLPVALVTTPQVHAHLIGRYVKKTGHNIAQWIGRNMLNVVLPNELDAADLLAVAKIHFPDMDDDALGAITGAATRSESYLLAVEAIAKRTRYIARRDKHASVTVEDLQLAIAECLPGVRAAKSTPEATPSPAPAKRLQSRLTRSATEEKAAVSEPETNRISGQIHAANANRRETGSALLSAA